MGSLGLLLQTRLLRRGLVGLWLVGAVAHFNCTYDVFRGEVHVNLPVRLLVRLLSAGVCLAFFLRLARWLALSSVFFARVVLVCGVARIKLLLAGALLFFDLLNGRSLCVVVVGIEIIQDLSCL